MTPSTEILIKRTAYQLAARYRGISNTTTVRTGHPSLQDRAQRLPVLRHDSFGPLVKAAYSAQPMDVASFKAVWSCTADIARNKGWRPAENYYSFFSTVFPDLKIPTSTPRGGATDPRGFLCQMLVIAHHRLTVDSSINVTPDEIILSIQGKECAVLSARSITWSTGHYLIREGGMPKIDFRQWSQYPLLGQRMLSTEAAALRNHLITMFPPEREQLDNFFRCVALLGEHADFIVREPFYIDITDDNLDQAWEVHSLLEAQRQLKAKR